jgi:hypothetical protein
MMPAFARIRDHALPGGGQHRPVNDPDGWWRCVN